MRNEINGEKELHVRRACPHTEYGSLEMWVKGTMVGAYRVKRGCTKHT